MAYWRQGETVIPVPITPGDYDNLRSGGVPPGDPGGGAVFFAAAEHSLFDTPSGRLESGCIVDKPEGYMIVKTAVGSPRDDRILVDLSKEVVIGTKDNLTVVGTIKGCTIENGFITF